MHLVDLQLETSTNEDAAFLNLVSNILNRMVFEFKPNEIRAIGVDNWFGPKWLDFSGVVALQVSAWRERTTFPPFSPKRIFWERRFLKTNEVYKMESEFEPTHKRRHSRENLRNQIVSQVKDGLLIWFSGNTFKNGKGCIMAFIVKNELVKTFYVEFIWTDIWRPYRILGESMELFKRHFFK